MKKPRLLVTGPIDSLDEFCAAAREQGWDAIEFPLLRVETSTTAPDFARGVRFDWIAITSRHALPFLSHLSAREHELIAIHCAVVGERTRAELEALGFRVAFDACANAVELGHELISRT